MVKSNIDKKFSAHYDAVEAELKSSTVGKLVLELDPFFNPIMWMRTAWCKIKDVSDRKSAGSLLVE